MTSLDCVCRELLDSGGELPTRLGRVHRHGELHLVPGDHGAPHVQALERVEENGLGAVDALGDPKPVLETGHNTLLAALVRHLQN